MPEHGGRGSATVDQDGCAIWHKAAGLAADGVLGFGVRQGAAGVQRLIGQTLDENGAAVRALGDTLGFELLQIATYRRFRRANQVDQIRQAGDVLAFKVLLDQLPALGGDERSSHQDRLG